MTQNTEQATDVATQKVTLTPEQEAALVQALQQDGEVLVQTQDDVGTEGAVGTEQPTPTVH